MRMEESTALCKKRKGTTSHKTVVGGERGSETVHEWVEIGYDMIRFLLPCRENGLGGTKEGRGLCVLC